MLEWVAISLSNVRKEVAKKMVVFLVMAFSRGNTGKLELWKNRDPARKRGYFNEQLKKTVRERDIIALTLS